MTQQDKENVLIAEFMGSKDYKVEELRYDCDWNWLIPVISKIRTLPEMNSLEIQHLVIQSKYNHVEMALQFTLDLQKTYESIIEFIEYYNNNKE